MKELIQYIIPYRKETRPNALGLKKDGTLWAWGTNAEGQLGTEAPDQCFNVCSEKPRRIGSETDWVKMAAGRSHSLALRADGTLWAWGANFSGQLGDGSSVRQDAPVQVGTDANWAAVGVGGTISFGLKTNGIVWAWGAASDLGVCTEQFRQLP